MELPSFEVFDGGPSKCEILKYFRPIACRKRRDCPGSPLVLIKLLSGILSHLHMGLFGRVILEAINGRTI